ncbi:hypothetical protein JAO75_05265 [Microvirga sp. BT325]|uniref:DUF4258 domain-containing protein n=1 Tax=Microvirga splendida TaxID=2795727 RepID=A0ABS0XYJ8_9HYPH|nr:hypothetical protein [Microvirga splendida]
MTSFAMTSHATERRRERAIPHFVLEMLQQHGSAFRSRGAERLIFDKAAVSRMERAPDGRGIQRLIEPWLNVYAVLGDDGAIVTVARRTRRMLRKTQRTWQRRGRTSVRQTRR